MISASGDRFCYNPRMSFLFIREALKRFKTQGSLFPSSPSLGKGMIKPLEFSLESVIVELGAGTGSFTKEIIAAMPEGAILVTFENNEALAAKLRDDLALLTGPKKVILIEDDAENLSLHLERLGTGKAHYVISGLPIGNFNRAQRQRIFDAIKAGMRDDGIYMQFQYLLASWRHVRSEFDAEIIGYEVRNIPPAFMYKCTKKRVV